MKHAKRNYWLPVLLCIAVVTSTVILPDCVAFEPKDSIIHGSIPVVYGCSDSDNFNLNGNKIRYSASGSSNMEQGYNFDNTEKRAFWASKLASLTDGDVASGLYVRPEKYSEKDRVIVIYSFSKHLLDSVIVNVTATTQKEIQVFASVSKTDLLKGEPACILKGARTQNEMEASLNGVQAAYLALVFESAKYDVNEISVFGAAADEGKSIIGGNVPSMYAAADDGKFTYNWRQVHYDTANDKKMYGYSETTPDTKNFWSDYTSRFTDGSVKSGLYMKPETYGNSKKIIIVYELPDYYNLSGFSINSDGKLKNCYVYVNSDRDVLFEEAPVSEIVYDSATERTDTLGNKKGKYIGFVFETPDFVINEISVYGNIFVQKSFKDSLIYNSQPSMYAPANAGMFTYNYHQIQYGTNVAEKNYGYSEAVLDSKPLWEPYTGKLTDADSTVGLYMKPELYGDSKRVVLVYDLSCSHILSEINILSDNTEKTYSIYFSVNRSELFDGEPDITVTKNKTTNMSETLSDKKARCIGIVFESPNYTLNEVLIYGSKFVPSEESKNIILGKTPTMYAPVNGGMFDYNYRKIQYDTGSTQKLYGYSEAYPDTKESWKQYVAALTDMDTDSGLYIKPEYYGDSKNVIIVYKFPDLYYANELVLKTDSKAKTYSVYISEIRSRLFLGEPCERIENNTSKSTSIELGNIRSKYIGIVLETPDYIIDDISVYGDLFVPQQKQKGENVLLNKTPSMYCSSFPNEYVFNWTQTAFAPNGCHYHGYTENDRVYYKEFWDTYTEKYTDGDDETGTYISPERSWYGDSVIAVYNIEDSYVNGFTIKTNSTADKTVQFFASSDRGSLFDNPVCELETDKKDIVDTGDVDVRAKYVGFVFQNPAYDIMEIIVNADKYQRPDYGTNLLSGKTPTSLYVAQREYPLIPSGIEIVDIDGTSKKLPNMTDNNFSTTSCLTPWYSENFPTKDSTYIVMSYDIGDSATLDKFLIDSSVGGFDIYVADNSLDLFKDRKNMVYTSNGDKLTDDGNALDPSTDLTSGEQVIDLNNAHGRFIGLVITRTAASVTENWGNTFISEIQLFGKLDNNDYGSNLVAKTEPVSIYRAGYDDYSLSQGEMTTQLGSGLYTDGIDNVSSIQFPNSGGLINYGNGLIVMVYYLQGNCDIKRVNIKSCFYYGIGGVDIYTADSYAELFESSNRVFTTEGYEATDGIYDLQKNLGSIQIPVYFDKKVSGRYIAFAFTRVSDSNVKGWGLLRLNELEVFGNRTVKEELPNTTILDKTTGSTATFNYKNPDEKFEFSKKRISYFRMEPTAEYSKTLFEETVLTGGYKVLENPFVFRFYDKNGNVIPNDALQNENITFDIKLKNNNFCFLGELIKDGVSVIKFASQNGSDIIYNSDDFAKKYVLLSFDSNTSQKSNYLTADAEVKSSKSNNKYYKKQQESNENSSKIKPKKTASRKWVSVEETDPLQWFWDIYDTFYENIWMLIACCGTLVLGIDAIVLGIALFLKRRKRK